MIFQDTITNDLDILTGLDLNWERFATTLEAELPRNTPIEIARACVRYVDLGQHPDIVAFKADDGFDSEKRALLIQKVRYLIGLEA